MILKEGENVRIYLVTQAPVTYLALQWSSSMSHIGKVTGSNHAWQARNPGFGKEQFRADVAMPPGHLRYGDSISHIVDQNLPRESTTEWRPLQHSQSRIWTVEYIQGPQGRVSQPSNQSSQSSSLVIQISFLTYCQPRGPYPSTVIRRPAKLLCLLCLLPTSEQRPCYSA